MSTLLEYQEIGSDTECEKITNAHLVNELKSGTVWVEGLDGIFPEEHFRIGNPIKRLDVRNDDIFVCSYPRAGTTWTQEMVWCIANDLDYQGAQVSLEERFPFLEISAFGNFMEVKEDRLDILPDFWTDSVKFVNELQSPRFIKSHLPFCLLPDKLTNFSTKAKIIYVHRNPKDTCVSLFHFSQDLRGYTGDFDTYCKLFLNETRYPFWEHFLKFWEQRNYPNILFLSYEEIKKDLPSAIRKTAAFLSKSLSEDQVASLAEHLSFENMKHNRAVNLQPWAEFTKRHREHVRNTSQYGAFTRSGTVGGWRSIMTSEIVEQFDAKTVEKLAGTGLKINDDGWIDAAH